MRGESNPYKLNMALQMGSCDSQLIGEAVFLVRPQTYELVIDQERESGALQVRSKERCEKRTTQ